MREIVERLTENRQIERAKSILESNGYSITKKSKRLKESVSMSWKETEKDFWRYTSVTNDPSRLQGSVSWDEDYKCYVADISDGYSSKDRKYGFKNPDEAKIWVEEYFS